MEITCFLLARSPGHPVTEPTKTNTDRSDSAGVGNPYIWGQGRAAQGNTDLIDTVPSVGFLEARSLP